MSENLSRLVLLNSCRFKCWEKSMTLNLSSMHSISETKMDALVKMGPESWKGWAEFNMQHITRTFPNYKTSVAGENFNPLIPWSMGCQLVSLNIQSPGAEVWVNDGRFRENGSCGYVLKPNRLIHGRSQASSAMREVTSKIETEFPVIVSLRVLAGNRLPRRSPCKVAKKSSILPFNPRVRVSLYDGMVSDHKNVMPLHHNTKVVKGNGLNPTWNESKTECANFKVLSPSLAMIVFSVWDVQDDGESGTFVGASAVPVSCMRQGYRSVPLFDQNHMRIGMHSFASLLVNARIRAGNETKENEKSIDLPLGETSTNMS